MATTNYQQTDTAQACALNNYCSTSGGTIEVGTQAEIGAGAGSTESTFTVASNQTDDNEFSFEVILPTDATSDADTATININFTTGNHAVQLASIFVCRVNSSCVNQETIGSSTGLSVPTNSGVQAPGVSCSAVTFAAGDKVIITLGFTSFDTMTDRTVGITTDQILVLPFNEPASSSTHPGWYSSRGGWF